MSTPYETDFASWAMEQAALLRSGNLDAVDVINVAEEIEGLARHERRELRSRLVVLIAHLLKWQFQPDRRGSSWAATIELQRNEILNDLDEMPSLRHGLDDPDWLAKVWRSAVLEARKETNLSFPTAWIWSLDQALDLNFWPD